MVILCARAIASGCCQDGAGRGNKAKAQLVSLCRTSGHYILTSTVYLSRSASVTCPVSAAAPGGLEKTAHSATGRPFSAAIPTGSAPCCPVLPRVPPARMRPQRGRGALPGVDAPQAASGPDNARATAACMQIRRGAGPDGCYLGEHCGRALGTHGATRGNTGQKARREWTAVDVAGVVADGSKIGCTRPAAARGAGATLRCPGRPVAAEQPGKSLESTPPPPTDSRRRSGVSGRCGPSGPAQGRPASAATRARGGHAGLPGSPLFSPRLRCRRGSFPSSRHAPLVHRRGQRLRRRRRRRPPRPRPRLRQLFLQQPHPRRR